MTELVYSMEKPKFNLGLALPSGTSWEADFGLSGMLFILALCNKPVPGYGKAALKIINQRGSLLPKSRQEMIQAARNAECTHLVFIDSDQSFPPYLIHRLASHQKSVIGCNIATKSIPASTTARQQHPTWWGGSPVYSKGRTGIEKVWRLGCGIMLLDLSIFDNIPLPWFEVRWHEELNEFIGEDWYLCQKLESHGIDIWVDHDLSLEVGHHGSRKYTHDDVAESVQDIGANYESITGPNNREPLSRS